jgi:hypothetical protein
VLALSVPPPADPGGRPQPGSRPQPGPGEGP